MKRSSGKRRKKDPPTGAWSLSSSDVESENASAPSPPKQRSKLTHSAITPVSNSKPLASASEIYKDGPICGSVDSPLSLSPMPAAQHQAGDSEGCPPEIEGRSGNVSIDAGRQPKGKIGTNFEGFQSNQLNQDLELSLEEVSDAESEIVSGQKIVASKKKL